MKLVVPVRQAVARMRAYQPPLEGRSRRLRLDFNENTAGCSAAVRRAMSQLSREQISMYPEYEARKRRLAAHFHVRPQDLLLTNGTDDALRLIVNTFVEPGSGVLLVEPTFAMYRFYCELAAAKIISLHFDAAMRFPLREVLRVLQGRADGAGAPPCVLFLANPNNPTGTLVSRTALQHVLRFARRTLVVVDEAYYDFCGTTVLPWVKRYPNLVVTRTFSKAAGLAGLRLGCLFTNRDVAAALRKAQSPYAVNAAALAALEAVIRDGRFTAEYVRQANRSKQEIQRALTKLGIPHWPSAANFVLVDFGSRAPVLLQAFRRRGILLRDRQGDFGRVGYVRITTGTPAQTRRLIRVLREVW